MPVRLEGSSKELLGPFSQSHDSSYASAFNGINRSPARVFERRITGLRSMKSISRHSNCLISQPRIVVLSASTEAK